MERRAHPAAAPGSRECCRDAQTTGVDFSDSVRTELAREHSGSPYTLQGGHRAERSGDARRFPCSKAASAGPDRHSEPFRTSAEHPARTGVMPARVSDTESYPKAQAVSRPGEDPPAGPPGLTRCPCEALIGPAPPALWSLHQQNTPAKDPTGLPPAFSTKPPSPSTRNQTKGDMRTAGTRGADPVRCSSPGSGQAWRGDEMHAKMTLFQVLTELIGVLPRTETTHPIPAGTGARHRFHLVLCDMRTCGPASSCG